LRLTFSRTRSGAILGKAPHAYPVHRGPTMWRPHTCKQINTIDGLVVFDGSFENLMARPTTFAREPKLLPLLSPHSSSRIRSHHVIKSIFQNFLLISGLSNRTNKTHRNERRVSTWANLTRYPHVPLRASSSAPSLPILFNSRPRPTIRRFLSKDPPDILDQLAMSETENTRFRESKKP